METVNEQGIKNLVFAIITRAIIDYEKALLNVELTKGLGGFTYEMAKSRSRECEQFFESDFCYLMTQVDGDQIIYACKQRIKEPHYNPDNRFHPYAQKKEKEKKYGNDGNDGHYC